MWQKLLAQLFHTPEGKPVRKIRASTLSSYYWCSPKAWLIASGVEVPRSTALSRGTEIHDNIAKARKPSPQEEEFVQFIEQFKDIDQWGGTLGRPWMDGKTAIIDDIGWIRTHGLDDFKVDNKRRVTNIEYKTRKDWRVYPVSLMPAVFQTRVYMYIYEPYLMMGGYYWKESWIVWLKRTRDGFEPIGETEITDYDATEVQQQITKIFDEWERASKAKTNEERRQILIPPKRYKCRMCDQVFKSQCPFQLE